MATWACRRIPEGPTAPAGPAESRFPLPQTTPACEIVSLPRALCVFVHASSRGRRDGVKISSTGRGVLVFKGYSQVKISSTGREVIAFKGHPQPHVGIHLLQSDGSLAAPDGEGEIHFAGLMATALMYKNCIRQPGLRSRWAHQCIDIVWGRLSVFDVEGLKVREDTLGARQGKGLTIS